MNANETFSEKKLEAAQLLLSLQDEMILDQIRGILDAANADWFDSLSEAEKAELDEADADIAAGRVSTHQDVMARMQAWIKK